MVSKSLRTKMMCQVCRIAGGQSRQVMYIDRDLVQIRGGGITNIVMCTRCAAMVMQHPIIIDTEAYGPPVNEDYLVLSTVVQLHRERSLCPSRIP